MTTQEFDADVNRDIAVLRERGRAQAAHRDLLRVEAENAALREVLEKILHLTKTYLQDTAGGAV